MQYLQFAAPQKFACERNAREKSRHMRVAYHCVLVLSVSIYFSHAESRRLPRSFIREGQLLDFVKLGCFSRQKVTEDEI